MYPMRGRNPATYTAIAESQGAHKQEARIRGQRLHLGTPAWGAHPNWHLSQAEHQPLHIQVF